MGMIERVGLQHARQQHQAGTQARRAHMAYLWNLVVVAELVQGCHTVAELLAALVALHHQHGDRAQNVGAQKQVEQPDGVAMRV